jgi:hypothetical protein
MSSPQPIALRQLPANFDSWKSVYWGQEGFAWQWEFLRPFFANKGYILYVDRNHHGLRAEVENDPAEDSFGLLGVRINFRPMTLLYCDVRIIFLHIHFEFLFRQS